MFKTWSDYTAAGDADFILYLDAKLPDPFYADFFINTDMILIERRLAI